ncbi:MAG: AMP-binding protein [Byssovorax sp.]
MLLPFSRLRRRVREGTRNALEIARLGRLGEPYSAPYEVVDRGPHHRLRRYATCADADAPAVILIPPLMLATEVYDVDHDVSVVNALGEQGILPFVVDFGAPEREEGGMTRTLDDHLRAVVSCVERVRALTGRDVHLCGYSQGGMFAYQAAAFLRSEGVRSIITFGSPVDIHKNLPALRGDIAGAIVRTIEPTVSAAIARIEGLPGVLTSTGFKLLSPRKEIQKHVDFVRMLHDRSAILRKEARRRFLGGEGFVAWPGPALAAFVEEFIVHNRMLSGGFVVDGRTVTLADITCPILAFIGASDEIARPATVKAIEKAAPRAPISFVTLRAGHFGLVVGSHALAGTWPTVSQWIHHQEGKAGVPDALKPRRAIELDDDLEAGDFAIELELFVDTIAQLTKNLMRRAGDAARGATDALDSARYQEPRLRRLAELSAGDRISPARALAEQASATPEATFFLWGGRAFSYRDADQRVSAVARGLYASGVRPGDKIGVVMGSRPSFLSAATALSRLGAAAVIAPPDAEPRPLAEAFERAQVTQVIADAERGPKVLAATGLPVLVLGGGGGARTLPAGLTDLEAIDPAAVVIPEGVVLDAGLAADPAMILLRPSDRGELRGALVTNHRWALSALGAAATTTLKTGDTVYCCVPLHHPTAILASVGAAIVGGARLALADGFDADTFLTEVRRAGATVVFYAGEMLRPLLALPPSRGDRSLPVRLFAGSGMRAELAVRLEERFGASALEFYASTTQKVILADPSGKKPGAIGRELPGSARVEVARCDLSARAPLRDDRGFLVRAPAGEPGLLVAELAPGEGVPGEGGVIEGAFTAGDRWFVSNDVVQRDPDGDMWFVDGLSGFVPTADGAVSTRTVEDALYGLPEIELCAVWPVEHAGSIRLAAAAVSREAIDPKRLDEAVERLPPAARPIWVAQLDHIALTDGFRPLRRALPREPPPARVHHLDPLDPLDPAGRYAAR